MHINQPSLPQCRHSLSLFLLISGKYLMHQFFCRSIQACPITFAIPGLHNKLLKPLAQGTSILKKTYWLEKLESNLHASDTTPQYPNTAVVELQSPCLFGWNWGRYNHNKSSWCVFIAHNRSGLGPYINYVGSEAIPVLFPSSPNWQGLLFVKVHTLIGPYTVGYAHYF